MATPKPPPSATVTQQDMQCDVAEDVTITGFSEPPELSEEMTSTQAVTQGSPHASPCQAAEAIASDTDSLSGTQEAQEGAFSDGNYSPDEDLTLAEPADPRAVNSMDDSLDYSDHEATLPPSLPPSQMEHNYNRSRGDSLDDFQIPAGVRETLKQDISTAVNKVTGDPPPRHLSDEERPTWAHDAMHLPVPDLFRWIEARTDFSCAPASSEIKRQRKGLAATGMLPAPEQSAPFYGLSSSTGITEGFDEFAKAFSEMRPASINTLIGKYQITKEPLPVHMSTYKLSDSNIQLEPLRPPGEGLEVVSSLKSNYRSTVRDCDLVRLEEHLRKSLVILSNTDAAMSAVLAEYPKKLDPDSMLMRALSRVTQGMQALADINIMNLHQIVTHRRDTAIDGRLRHKLKPTAISDEHLVQLRHGPILDRVDLFDLDMLKTIQAERDALSDKKLHTAILSRVAYSTPIGPRSPKRQHPVPSTSASSQPSRPKQRRQSSQSTPATSQKPVHQQQQQPFPSGGAGQQQSHR